MKRDINRLARWLHESVRARPEIPYWRPWGRLSGAAKGLYRHTACKLLENPPACLRRAILKGVQDG